MTMCVTIAPSLARGSSTVLQSRGVVVSSHRVVAWLYLYVCTQVVPLGAPHTQAGPGNDLPGPTRVERGDDYSVAS